MSRRDGYVWNEARPSALATFFKCSAFVVGVSIACGTGIAFHGINILDHRARDVIGMAGSAFHDLPGFIRQLPPVLSDAMKDQRAPGYVADIELSGRIVAGESRRGGRAVIEIENRGDKVISLLALRAVMLDDHKQPMNEATVYGATPLAVDDEWRGPMFPKAKRRVVVWCPKSAESLELEIADLRTWTGEDVPEASAKDDSESKTVAAR